MRDGLFIIDGDEIHALHGGEDEDLEDLKDQVDIFLKYAKEKNANRERSERELRETHTKEMQGTRDKPT